MLEAFVGILLMLTFGLLGLVMVHFDWPRPPIVLGLVLGDLAETYLLGLFAVPEIYDLAVKGTGGIGSSIHWSSDCCC